MLRIGSMNMLLHGVEIPDIRYRDSAVGGREAETRELHADSWQTHHLPAASTMSRRRRICSGS